MVVPAEVLEDDLHGVVVRLRQPLHQIFNGMQPLLVVGNLCHSKEMNDDHYNYYYQRDIKCCSYKVSSYK